MDNGGIVNGPLSQYKTQISHLSVQRAIGRFVPLCNTLNAAGQMLGSVWYDAPDGSW